MVPDARAAGATTSLDAGADPDGTWDGGLQQALADVDHLLPNAVEACAIAGRDDVAEAALRLAEPAETRRSLTA